MATMPTMLLPSAFSCDSSQYQSHTRLHNHHHHQSSTLFASPPTSPVTNPHSTLFATCRALQSMLSSPPPTAPSQLPTPPMTHAPPPPNPNSFKLRLRSRNKAHDGSNADAPPALSIPRKKIMKRTAPPRGINKRRREVGDVSGRELEELVEDDVQQQAASEEAPERNDTEMAPVGPSTPKRQRLFAPEILPLGLERSDFRTLRLNTLLRSPSASADEGEPTDQTSQEEPTTTNENKEDAEQEEEEWTSEEDRILVELVLEKLKLSKSDWQDCARSLGKDRGSVGKRWKSLIIGGEVGLKARGGGGRGQGRGRICNTWR